MNISLDCDGISSLNPLFSDEGLAAGVPKLELPATRIDQGYLDCFGGTFPSFGGKLLREPSV